MNPLQQLKPIRVQDDVIDYDRQTKYLFKSGPAEVSYQNATLNQISNSALSGNMIPPGIGASVDRHALISLCYRVTLTGADQGDNLFVPNFMGLRFLPITHSMSSASIQINTNGSSAVSPIRYIDDLMRYKDRDALRKFYSKTAWAQDLYPSFEYFLSQQGGTGGNPLNVGLGEGGFNYEGRGTVLTHVASNTPTSAVIYYYVTECIPVSPYLMGEDEEGRGFIGVTQLDFNFVFSNLNGLYCIGNDGSIPVISNAQVDICDGSVIPADMGGLILNANPRVQFRFLTPNATLRIPENNFYNYYYLDNHLTRCNQLLASDFGAGNSFSGYSVTRGTCKSNAIQVQGVPSRVYVSVRKNQELLLNSDPDVKMFIERVAVQFNNKSGYLSTASPEDLFSLSVRNGLRMTYKEARLVGYPLCIDFARDIGLREDLAPGSSITANFYITCDYYNTTEVDQDNLEISLTFVYDGLFFNKGLAWGQETHFLSREDVVKAKSGDNVETITYSEAEMLHGGAFGNIKKIIGKAKSYLKSDEGKAQIKSLIKKYGPKVMDLVKMYGPEIAEGILMMVGLGGGKQLSQADINKIVKIYEGGMIPGAGSAMVSGGRRMNKRRLR